MRQAEIDTVNVREFHTSIKDENSFFEFDIEQSKILIVDDTKTNVDILVQALGEEFKLAVALNGSKALEYLNNNSVDLILLDIMMPGMSGFEVCQKVKKNPTTYDIPVIFITAINSIGGMAKGFKVGAVDYITKPFNIVEVRTRVKTHLNLKFAREALKNQNKILEEKVNDRTRKLSQAQIEIIDRLALAAEYRDNETGQHIRRMKEYCMLLGKAAGMSEEVYTDFALASTMHDVGKIGIPDRILLKPGKLTAEEFVLMQKHTKIGSNILGHSKSSLLQLAEIISETHHERWDGTGYPRGLKGEEIPLEGRIVCIADVFDALITERPYKNAWFFDEAMKEIKSNSGSQFDARLVEIFTGMEGELRNIINKFGID